MTPEEHKDRAEALLDEGVKVVNKITHLSDLRIKMSEEVMTPHIATVIEALTEKMDEYGKKAMGIWAQAQVHATLSRGLG